ncbi:MAG: NUDIX hydrolase N-terminal domain-containing protein [Anaerolineae bacterium]|nr:NUDIX hydrolase N-terminal domain-containing protein [Anaerolineae bacterium]
MAQTMTPAQQLALWADQLRDVSAMGLHFSRSIYDTQHYQTVQNVAMEMLALATGELPEQIEPLRAPIFDRPTPFACGDAAIIDDAGQILLIRRADNGLWAMPGGALEVGETPAEGVVREAWEETGVRCQAAALVGVFDSRLCGSITRHHLYMFVFLCRPLEGPPEPPSHANEVLETRWFAGDALPVDLDPGHATRIPQAFRVWRGDQSAFFDKP